MVSVSWLEQASAPAASTPAARIRPVERRPRRVQARQAMYHDKESLLWQLCGGNPELVEAKTVFDAAAAGDETGLKLLDGYTPIFSEGLTNLINIFQPAYLCIGGGVSKAGDALLVPLKEKIRSRLYSKNAKKNTQIVLARLNNDAGILGAALLEK